MKTLNVGWQGKFTVGNRVWVWVWVWVWKKCECDAFRVTRHELSGIRHLFLNKIFSFPGKKKNEILKIYLTFGRLFVKYTFI